MAYDWGDGKGRIRSIPLQQHLQNIGSVAVRSWGGAYGGVGLGHAPGPTAAPVKGQPQPQAQASPVAGAGGSAPTPSGGTPQFIPDAQYLAEAAQRAHDRQTAIDNYNLQDSQDANNRDEAIRQLLQRVGDDKTSLDESANRQGLFYSGKLTKQLSDYDRNLQEAQGQIATSYQQGADARQAAIRAIQQGAPLEEATALAQAAGRQISADTASAANNSLVANAASGAPDQPSVIGGMLTNKTGNARAGQQFTVQPGQGGAWHIYANRRVWVPAHR